ncbi:MAG: zinc-binding dehydrogenase [Candidatus Humimicrobiia bacterium]
MKSRVMVLEKFNKPLVLKEIEIPKLDKGQVLVKLEASGVCGSDVHMWKGEDPRIILPIILGHEGGGKVVEMKGKKFTAYSHELNIGDTILWNRGITCGRCYACTILKEPSLCQYRKTYGINISNSPKLHLDGCYSEYIILDRKTDIFKVNNSIDTAILVSASCSGATMAHGYDMFDKSLIGETIIVQGAGPLGVYAVAFAKNLGASNIIVIERSKPRLDLCKEFGATQLLNIDKLSKSERKDRIMDITNGRGAALVVEAAGVKGVAEEGIKLVRKGGTYLSVGYAQPTGKEEIDFYADIVSRNLRIQGVWVSDTRHTMQAINLVMNNIGKFEKLITHRFSLENANKAISVMNKKEALKAVLTFKNNNTNLTSSN